MKIFFLSLLLCFTTLYADISEEQKVQVLTDYLINIEHKSKTQARNEAIATVYGQPKFKQLSYDDDTEMFFARVVSTKGNSSKKVNFYMPRKRAIEFKKNPDKGRIEVEHIMKDNKLEFVGIDLDFKGIKYPMAIKTDTSMTLEIGGYFIASQNSELYAKKNGLGSSINLQELFHLKEETKLLRLDFSYEFNQKHKIEASYYSMNNSNTNTVDPFIFDDVEISGEIASSFDTDIYKLTYIYSAYRTNSFELMTRVGFHLTKFATTLDSIVVVDGKTTSSELVNLSLPAPLPVFGLGFKYDITSDLALRYHIDYFFISLDVSGTMVDTEASLEYMLNDYIGLACGINSTKMDVEAQVGQTLFGVSHDISGLKGSIIFKY